ncbi:MAG: BrnT family toxin [Snowella sp.]|nr:BrnT family toxin [Snowella sp.]
MAIDVDGFDWDQGNENKCQKHGLSKIEIETLFKSQVWVAPDLKHSDHEQRYLAIGRSVTGKPIFVAFTLRTNGEKSLIRPISARYMHQKEIEKYEQAFTSNNN